MDSFELNKIIGAVLGTLLFVMGVGFLAEAIYHPAEGAGPGYELPGDTGGEDTSSAPPPPATVDSIGTLLAKADVAAGEAGAKKCLGCHDLSPANGNKSGPGLYDVVERKIASHPGFTYSQALMDKSAEIWTYEHLDSWLTSPKTFAPGTKMAFGGIKDAQDRANLIAYLSTLSASPKPFPPADGAAPAAAAPAAEAPAASAPAATEAAPSSAPAP